MIDIHAFDRDIPAGKVLLAEYGAIGAGDRRPETTVLSEAFATLPGWTKTRIRLVARSAGWAIAGSMLRWDNGHYAVEYDFDNAHHGSRYLAEPAARAHFERLTRCNL